MFVNVPVIFPVVALYFPVNSKELLCATKEFELSVPFKLSKKAPVKEPAYSLLL